MNEQLEKLESYCQCKNLTLQFTMNEHVATWYATAGNTRGFHTTIDSDGEGQPTLAEAVGKLYRMIFEGEKR